jgi:tetratricopeptide (TPR) repeat protein
VTVAPHEPEHPLAGRCLAVVGKLASMSRRDAEKLIRERGGRVAARVGADVDTVIVSDQIADLSQVAADEELFDDAARSACQEGRLELVRESELWARLGMVDAQPGVERLYTPAMLADLLGVPISAVRQWHRKGALRATREVRRLAYFDFEEVRVARKLAALLAAGCSLSAINRKLDELARLLPDVPRPLADAAVVVEGRCLYIRRGGGLAEPSGQLLIDFDAPQTEPEARRAATPVAISLAEVKAARQTQGRPGAAPPPLPAEELRSLAAELEEDGRRDQAIEAYRALLVSGEFSAEDNFFLAELLYRQGDLAAARERYYVAIELDEDYVEARANLGCVLMEQGDWPLAEAAFRGALEFHPDYADAHYHLARLLDRLDRHEEALAHWQTFVDLAPASPWADEAHDRLAAGPPAK